MQQHHTEFNRRRNLLLPAGLAGVEGEGREAIGLFFIVSWSFFRRQPSQALTQEAAPLFPIRRVAALNRCFVQMIQAI